MAQKRFYWLKLHEDFFRQKDIKRLRHIAGGDTYTIIYLKLLLRSLENGGKLYYDGVEDDFASEMALDIDETVENVKITVQFLIARGILQKNDDVEYELVTAAEMTGSEADSARRVREYRRRKALHCNDVALLCDSGVTKSNTEKDKEKREKIEDISSSELSGESPDQVSKNLFPHDSKPYKLAAYLDEQVISHSPSCKKRRTEGQLQKWAATFDLMNRRDGIPWDAIRDVLVFSQKDSFWQTNILSADKFRKQYVQLEMKMHREEDRSGE